MWVGIARQFDDLLGSFIHVALALAVGGLVWGLVGLRGWRAAGGSDGAGWAAARARTLALAQHGALALVLFQASHLGAKLVVLADAVGRLPLTEVLELRYFQSALTRIALAALLALLLGRLRGNPDDRRRWLAALAAGGGVIACGAFLVHAAARLDDGRLMMTMTALHQAAAAVWVGGVVNLAVLWRLGRTRPEVARLWPRALGRFSPIGMAAVGLLLATGTPLALTFVATLDGLLGSAYGSLLVSKGIVLAALLGLAALHFRAGRKADHGDFPGSAPATVETEAILLTMVLFLAAALAALPPSIDVVAQHASWREVLASFLPRIPQLTSPTATEELAVSATVSGVVARTAVTARELWSDYNHNMSGLLLLLVGAGALADRTGRLPPARHWPLLFILLGLFVLIRADNNFWPLGPRPLWEVFAMASALQHKIATVIVFAMAILEWRARTAASPGKLPYMFPVLCLAGGVLLLTHSHGAFEMKVEYLEQVTHTAMGVLALFIGAFRWLELRLGPDSRAGRRAGLLAVLCLIGVAIVLIFYREPIG